MRHIDDALGMPKPAELWHYNTDNYLSVGMGGFAYNAVWYSDVGVYHDNERLAQLSVYIPRIKAIAMEIKECAG